MQVVAVFKADNSALPGRLTSGDWPIYEVSPHVMHKLAGLEDTSGLGAVAEIVLPSSASKVRFPSKQSCAPGFPPVASVSLCAITLCMQDLYFLADAKRTAPGQNHAAEIAPKLCEAESLRWR